jgi:hypothetical protein
VIAAATADWALRVGAKASCLSSRRKGDTGGKPATAVPNEAADVSFFLFHTRKAAGTTLRAFLEQQCAGPYRSSRRQPQPSRAQRNRRGAQPPPKCLLESEGLALTAGALELLLAAPLPRGLGANTITVSALRHPVRRAWSLYWYEHVGWWDGVKHEPSEAKPLGAWLDSWQDGSPWKEAFGVANPGSTYVEPSDYFVKCFGGWRGPGRASRAHLAQAKATLAAFDVVLITERLGDPAHLAPLRALVGADLLSAKPGGGGESSQHALKADDEPKQRLGPRLLGGTGGGEAALLARLGVLNALDLDLWAFANGLADAREAYVAATGGLGRSRVLEARVGSGAAEEATCVPGIPAPFAGPFAPLLGIHRPPKHKL